MTSSLVIFGYFLFRLSDPKSEKTSRKSTNKNILAYHSNESFILDHVLYQYRQYDINCMICDVNKNPNPDSCSHFLLEKFDKYIFLFLFAYKNILFLRNLPMHTVTNL